MPSTRREFLRRTALTTLGLGIAPRALRAAATKAPSGAAPPGDPVIVAVFLDGGNDGLNTIVPLVEYDLYRELRPRVGLDRDRLLPLPGHTSSFGVNPGFAAMVDLFAAGKVAIINGVGPPVDALGLFNHEASQKIFVTAGAGEGDAGGPPTGWLGRAADSLESGDLPTAIGVGASGGKAALVGASSKPLILSSIAGFRVLSSGAADLVAPYRRIQEIAGGLRPAAEYNRQLRLEVLEFSETLQQVAAAHGAISSTPYPVTGLASALRDCAALIAADRGVRVLSVSLGGFDTHGGQNKLKHAGDRFGYHERLLEEVGEAVAAFSADLEAIGSADRVVILVYSEFGRRVPDNTSFGTDHGFGSTMFVVGNRVRGGVYGESPSLADLVLAGNLAAPVDFRSVYATLLADHLDLDPDPILGGSFPPIGFLG